MIWEFLKYKTFNWRYGKIELVNGTRNEKTCGSLGEQVLQEKCIKRYDSYNKIVTTQYFGILFCKQGISRYSL